MAWGVSVSRRNNAQLAYKTQRKSQTPTDITVPTKPAASEAQPKSIFEQGINNPTTAMTHKTQNSTSVSVLSLNPKTSPFPAQLLFPEPSRLALSAKGWFWGLERER